MKQPKILAIDTSCDDTSAAVIQGTTLLSNIIASQTELHKPYGGVFPTVAKLAHKENIDRTIAVALQRAQTSWDEVTAIAVTVGPGLAPALEVGITKAKELATKYSKPLIPVNHIEGHVLSVLGEAKKSGAYKNTADSKKTKAGQFTTVQFPVLSVIVSGGHTQFVLIKKIGDYQILGSTLDDAAGECLDKIGRMLHLGYPAGPIIEQFAKKGNPKAYQFPLPLTTVKNFDLSFSGLKTFARNFLDKKTQSGPLTKQEVYDVCASIQYAVFRHICYKLTKILEQYEVKEVWLGGGVAANMNLRKSLRQTIQLVEKKQKLNKKSILFRAPYTKRLCMDNAAMIGIVGAEKYTNNEFVNSEQQAHIERVPKLQL